MLQTGVVRVSGRGSNVEFTIDDTEAIDLVIRGLREYLVDNHGLWSSGAITVNVGRRMLSRNELSRIKQVLQAESGLTVTRFWCSPEALEQGQGEKDGAATVDSPPAGPVLLGRLVQPQAELPDQPLPSRRERLPHAADGRPTPFLSRRPAGPASLSAIPEM